MQIEQVLVISTAHISEGFNRFLTVNRNRRMRLGIEKMDFGWLVVVQEETDPEAFQDTDFQQQYETLQSLGRKRGVDRVRLDRDADIDETTPVFDWR